MLGYSRHGVYELGVQDLSDHARDLLCPRSFFLRPDISWAHRSSKAEQEKTDKMLIKSLEREERERKRVHLCPVL